jgi:hypothetical protein
MQDFLAFCFAKIKKRHHRALMRANRRNKHFASQGSPLGFFAVLHHSLYSLRKQEYLVKNKIAEAIWVFIIDSSRILAK